MASYWPTPTAIENDPIIADKMNSIPKIVFSRTLRKVDWNNTRLAKDIVAEEVLNLKRQPGKDIGIFGSSHLAITFVQHGLIDELRIMVNPVVLGSGTPLLKGIDRKFELRLLRTKTFNSGNVLFCYKPKGN